MKQSKSFNLDSSPQSDLISFCLSDLNYPWKTGTKAEAEVCTYLRKKEYSYQKKKRTKKRWLTRWRGLKAQPWHASVYQTSTLVCVMTLSTEEQGNFTLPAFLVSGRTRWRENRVQRTCGHPSSSSCVSSWWLLHLLRLQNAFAL